MNQPTIFKLLLSHLFQCRVFGHRHALMLPSEHYSKREKAVEFLNLSKLIRHWHNRAKADHRHRQLVCFVRVVVVSQLKLQLKQQLLTNKPQRQLNVSSMMVKQNLLKWSLLMKKTKLSKRNLHHLLSICQRHQLLK